MRGDQYLYGDEAADTVDVSEYDGCMCGFCVIRFIVEQGGLVPVEPCEHGMIPSHPVLAALPDGEMVWTGIVCPGAGIGGDDG